MHKYAGKRFREYETILILSPQINQSAADTITKKVEGMIAQFEGKFTKVSLWGMRRLSYRIKRQDKGIYYQLNYVSPQGFVDEMEKYFRLNDNILRYLSVRVSEELVDPAKVIIKSSDIEFGSVEGLNEMASPEPAPHAEPHAEESAEISEETEDFAEVEVEAGEKEPEVKEKGGGAEQKEEQKEKEEGEEEEKEEGKARPEDDD